jgi:hypothetical protein
VNSFSVIADFNKFKNLFSQMLFISKVLIPYLIRSYAGLCFEKGALFVLTLYFSPMIPKLFEDIWEEGMKSNFYHLKLCGAGGGGFMLGHCQDFFELHESLKDYEIRPLFRF